MNDVSNWLDRHGLAELQEMFERERIDLQAARNLTDSDLRELALPLGLRTKLRVAIHDLQATDAAEHYVGSTTAAPHQAERRQLTILFCDLVGSTSLSQRLDPEALRELMQTYQQACRSVIAKYEGHVAQYLGDGVMAYFGWPRAHEDDGERAVRSALEVVDAVGQISAPSVLQVRVGIATGPVVVGETGDGDASVPKLAVGETPNLAARLQGLAGPNEIAIAPSTHRLLGATFEFRDLGEHALKGIIDPVHAWQVLSLSRTESRFDAARGRVELSRLVGRENELSLLRQRWAQAKIGEGQLVLLGGEPGIGKSRITQAIREELAIEPHWRVHYQCSPYHTQSTLHPVMEQMEYAAGFLREDTAAQKLDRVEALLQSSGQDIAKTGALFAALLSLPLDRYPQLNYSPQRQKEELLQALVDHIGGLANGKPVLIVFEDAHWTDPTTHEALNLLVARISKWRVMLLITHRPEYSPPWSGEAHVTTLTLNRFNRRLGAQLAESITGGKPLPPEVIEQIVAKTDGVPLFVEELTKHVIESGLLKDTGSRYDLDGPLPPLAIPSTLHDSLMARLDRLAPVKEVAQCGACIGREFSYELLAAISPMNERKLEEALKQLVRSQLVFQQGTPPRAIYTFKHALVQDAAYGSLLKSRRQQLHRSIAQTMEKLFPEQVAQAPEVLAHHYTEAGLTDPATNYWLKAGQRGVERFANAEAIVHLTQGLDTLQSLPLGTERDQRELLLQINMGSALGNSRGYSPPEVGLAFARAKDLCDRVGDMPQMFSALNGLWLYYAMRAEYVTAAKFGDQILELSRRSDIYHHPIAANNIVGINALFTGQFGKAHHHFAIGFEVYERAGLPALGEFYGYDPGINCCEWLAWTSMIRGFGDRSRDLYQTAVRAAYRNAEPLAVATTLVHLSAFNMLCADPAAALSNSRRAVAFCTENRILLRQVQAEMIEGWARAELGVPTDGMQQLQSAHGIWATLGARIFDTGWYIGLVCAQVRVGNKESARDTLRKAFDMAESTGEAICLSDLHRLDGAFGLCVRHPNAESCFREAVRVAQSQDAKLFEIRAATDLCRLLQSQGRNAEALRLLKPVFDWFTEGFDTKELRDARRLLDDLAS